MRGSEMPLWGRVGLPATGVAVVCGLVSLKALEVVVVIDDKKGEFADKVEESIRAIEGVQSIEAIETGLM